MGKPQTATWERACTDLHAGDCSKALARIVSVGLEVTTRHLLE